MLSGAHQARQHSRKAPTLMPRRYGDASAATRQMSKTEKPVRAGEEIFLSWPVLHPESRESCVRKDLTRRLKSVCGSMSTEDFQGLVLEMTREQLRGERVLGRVFGDS